MNPSYPYSLDFFSPCTTANSRCSHIIGARYVGCGAPNPVKQTS